MARAVAVWDRLTSWVRPLRSATSSWLLVVAALWWLICSQLLPNKTLFLKILFGQRPGGMITSSASPVSGGPNGPIIQIASRPQLIPVSVAASGGSPQRTTLTQRVVQLPQHMRPSQPGQTVLRQGMINSPQITLAPNALNQMNGPRTILIKSADGNSIQMVQIPANANLGPTLIRAPQQGGPAPGTPTTFRTPQGTQIVVSSVALQQSLQQQQQQQQQTKMVVGQGSPMIGGAPQTVTQTLTVGGPAASSVSGVPTNTPLSIQTTTANAQAASAAPSQMSPSTAKKKCKNFLSTLIRLANDQPDQVANNVRSLIQGLVDDTIQPEDFTNQLQKELNSSPQPCLVPFLKKSLPYLRYSLLKEELTIDGVRAPLSNTVTITSGGMAIGNGTAAAQQQAAAQAQMGVPHGLTQLQHLSRPQQMAQTVRLITAPQAAGWGGPLGHGGPQIITSLPHGSNLGGTPIMLTSAIGGGQLLTTATTAQQHQLHHQHQQQQNAAFQQQQQQQLATSLGVGPQQQQQPGSTLLSAATTIPQTRMTVPQMVHAGLPVHQMGTSLNPVTMNTCQIHPGALTIAPPPPRATTPSKPKAPSKSKAKEKAEAKKAAAAAAVLAAANAASAGGAASGFPGAAGPIGPGGEKGGAGGTTSSFRDDDDINDVAAMGGVNLQEESQRILGTGAEIIGQQIRSCKDEPFLHGTPLHSRINGIVKKHELTDCSPDVIALVSHAVQERLKTLVEKLGCIAEHRQEQFKNNPNYIVYQDVKAQVQFLQELDRIEKKRHEEQEREVLIKAAKSRSKMDDPDHIAIKARAKEMQRQEMEEIRQREANETALQAIGFPKKRQKTGPTTSSAGGGLGGGGGADGSFGGGGGGSLNNLSSSSNGLGLGSSSSSLANNGGSGGLGGGSGGGGGTGGGGASSKPAIKRIKRVTMKDVYFMMEHEHDTVRSHCLYRTYAR